ncbi:MAG: flagellar motor switch protein FliM [Limisphaerales bacterium]
MTSPTEPMEPPAPGAPPTDTGAGAEVGSGTNTDADIGSPAADPAFPGPVDEPPIANLPSVEEAQVWVHRAGKARELRDAGSIRTLDFRSPTAFSPVVLRRMRQRHEEFVRALSARLSLYLRMEFTLQLGPVNAVPYRELISSLPDPTHITLFRIEPLPGIGLVNVRPRLAMTIVDRLLGGPAQALTTEHTPSEIELALLDQAVHVVLSEWATFWSGTPELKSVILGYENNGRFLKTSPHDTVMLVLTLDSHLGDCEEPIQIAFPHYTLEPLVPALGQSADSSQSGIPVVRTEGTAWNPRFADVPVTLTAEWEGLELSAREIGNLKVGDVVPLEGTCVEEVRVRLADVARFRGRLGASGDQLAVELTAPWKP